MQTTPTTTEPETKNLLLALKMDMRLRIQLTLKGRSTFGHMSGNWTVDVTDFFEAIARKCNRETDMLELFDDIDLILPETSTQIREDSPVITNPLLRDFLKTLAARNAAKA